MPDILESRVASYNYYKKPASNIYWCVKNECLIIVRLVEKRHQMFLAVAHKTKASALLSFG